jgi:hypothetical protein
MASLLRRGANWSADSLRFLGAAFYWNFRKTLYVLRRRRGDCPCQNESDDSVPGRVRCDAVLHWHQPGRFRRICPLLVQTPDGWRCSVHFSQVRPFWGRVVAWSAATALGLYLLAALTVFVGFRTLGHSPVQFLQVAWPGRWQELKEVQSEALFRRAMTAFREGRMAEAQLALGAAQARDPKNYEAALLLAQIAMFQRSFLFSDELFARLWREHPEQKLRTALVYHDTLLGTDRMTALAEWSVGIAGEDPARATAWLRSALLAVRAMPVETVPEWLKRNGATVRKLAPHARRLLEAELAARTGSPADALATLKEGNLGAFNSYYVIYQLQRMAEWGDLRGAQLALDQVGNVVGDFDRGTTQTILASVAGDSLGARAAFRAVLKLPLTSQRVERLAGLLVGYPDEVLYRDLVERIRKDSALEPTVDGPAMWITGIVCGVPTEAEYWRKGGRHLFALRRGPPREVNFRSRDPLDPTSVINLVNTVSMPREVILALFQRLPPQVSRPVRPGASPR